MTSLKDLTKLATGLSLVAKEAIKQTNLNKPNAIQSVIRQAVLSVTDISGLTKGEIRNFTVDDDSKPNSDSKNDTVVYFNEITPTETANSSEQSIVTESDCVQDAVVDSKVDLAGNVVVEEKEGVVDLNDVAVKVPPLVVEKQRRRKERKVPSTPFSRALG